ncbi:hypothetical protein ACIBCH_36680 [Amycolatopsis thailandensis]|uniref:hypothetical protein n=1 Tax=Amycolatopsis thailandensis TaxID=589330 RepID=UPI00379166B7
MTSQPEGNPWPKHTYERPMNRVPWNSAPPDTNVEARIQKTNAEAWQPVKEMEEWRVAKRRNPDQFDRVVTGAQRMSFGNYMNMLRAYVAEGYELPEGITAPGPDEA